MQTAGQRIKGPVSSFGEIHRNAPATCALKGDFLLTRLSASRIMGAIVTPLDRHFSPRFHTMSLSPEEVNRIAWLARLSIDAEKTEAYARDLSGILDFIEQMSAVDTNDVSPMAHPLDQVQRLRPDVVSEENQREVFQSIAPKVEAGLYLVPKVIE